MLTRTVVCLVVVALVAAAAPFVGCSSSSQPAATDGGAHDSGTVGPGMDSATGAQDSTSTTTDSGTPPTGDSGAPSPDSGPAGDAGASCVGLAYCDDFESYDAGALANATMLGAWAASLGGTGATMAVDTVMPYQSKQSLHITVPANPDGGAAHGTLSQKAPSGLVVGNNLFGRAMLYYSNTGGNGLPLAVHSWIFNADGPSTAADGGVTMNLGGGGAKLQINYHPPAPLPEQSVQGGTMTAGAWHCVQWEYDGSVGDAGVVDDAKVWVDGQLAVEAPKTKGWNFATPWNVFDFGFTHYQNLPNPVDVYLDDFALDGAMVPCP